MTWITTFTNKALQFSFEPYSAYRIKTSEIRVFQQDPEYKQFKFTMQYDDNPSSRRVDNDKLLCLDTFGVRKVVVNTDRIRDVVEAV